MKNICFLSALLFLTSGISLSAQTLEAEYKSMMDKYLSGKLSQVEFRDVSFAWRALIDSVGYPDVPYDSASGKVEYIFTSSLEGIPRETIVNRVSEWAAVSFGSPAALLTSQGETSRLILNGSLELFFPDLSLVWKNSWKGYVETEFQNSSLCYFTLEFTIKKGRMRTRVLNLSYEYTDFISDRTVSRTLKSFFPVSSNEQDEWKAIITLVNETGSSLDAMIGVLNAYIADYVNDYNW